MKVQIVSLYANNLDLCCLAERNLAMKVGGADNLSQLQRLKGLLDPTNMFKNHQLLGLMPITSAYIVQSTKDWCGLQAPAAHFMCMP